MMMGCRAQDCRAAEAVAESREPARLDRDSRTAQVVVEAGAHIGFATAAVRTGAAVHIEGPEAQATGNHPQADIHQERAIGTQCFEVD